MQGSTTLPTVDLTPITSALSASIGPSQVATIMASVVTAGVALVLIWFGGRKLIRGVMSALKRGRLSV